MARRPRTSISEQLNAAQVAITNSLSDAEIQGLVAGYGYNQEKLNEGKSLYETAVNAANAQIAAAGTQYQSTAKMAISEQEAWEAYQALAKVARAVFSKEPARLAQLGLKGTMPRTTAGFLAAAYAVFDNALSIAEIKMALNAYGYSEEKLRSERAKAEAYDQANQVQEAAKGAAQQATREQDAAVAAMSDWVAQYVKIAKVALREKPELLEKIGIMARSGKTAAQRGAGAKAAATRRAKKESAK